MSTALLPCVELEPRTPAQASVIWLHGLGADGHDFEPIAPHLGLPAALAVRFVFPHAPARPVTLNGGLAMRAWYDIAGADLGAAPDIAGLRASAHSIAALIARENARGISSSRIALAGFSQGGAVALFSALRHAQPLAGLVLLSTYLLGAAELEREADAANARLPVLQVHGTEDMLVRYERGRALRDWLQARGHPLEFLSFAMEHQANLEEIHAIGRFLAARLGAAPARA